MALWIAMVALSAVCDFGLMLAVPPGHEIFEGGFALGMGITIALELALAVALYTAAPLLVRRFGELETSTDVTDDRFEIGALALRLAGIFIVDEALRGAPRIVTAIERPLGIDDRGERFFAISLAFAFFAIGVALVWRARPIARVLFRTVAPRDVSASELAQAIAFSGLGVSFFVGSLPEVLEGITDAW